PLHGLEQGGIVSILFLSRFHFEQTGISIPTLSFPIDMIGKQKKRKRFPLSTTFRSATRAAVLISGRPLVKSFDNTQDKLRELVRLP
ncbi:MAG: hypothetical protein ABI618_16035, partial [Nitrospirota bacterium]